MTVATKSINTIAVNQYLSTAFTIGLHLAKTALWDKNRCNWVGSSVEAINGSFQVVEKTFGRDLYSGTSGIALFLSLLLEQKPDGILQETLEGAVNQVLSGENSPDVSGNYGYYGGKLGTAVTLITIGETMKRKDWEAKGWEQLMAICQEPIHESEIDVISGAAGTIPILIGVHNRSNHKAIGEAMVKCGDFLLEKAVKTESYWSWPSIGLPQGTTGYSHGAAGIATALLELYKITGNAAYFTGAMMGFNFERINFNPQVQNWPDFRNFQTTAQAQPLASPQLNYGEAWCHGAPGIALSRLKAWQITNDPSFRQEAEIALATTHRSVYNSLTNQAIPSNFSICHGLAGNADVLLEGGNILSNEQYTQVAKEVGNYGIKKYQQNGLAWPSGVNDPSGVTPGMSETPGLMIGLAGTGYFYLRLAFPEKIKSLLLL